MTSTFPKVVKIRGVEIAANSWEEVDELMARYGAHTAQAERDVVQPRQETALDESDRSLLERFIREAERGIPVDEIRRALGRSGRGKVGSALRAWSAKIGLMTRPGSPAFEPRQSAQGRVHRLTDDALRGARILLGRSVVALARDQ